MEPFIIIFPDSVGWLCSARWFSHRVSHVVAVRWWLGLWPSDGLTGLDIWDGSLPWLALEAGSGFSCDCQPEYPQVASRCVLGFSQMVEKRECPTSKSSKRTKQKLLWLLMTWLRKVPNVSSVGEGQASMHEVEGCVLAYKDEMIQPRPWGS